MDMNENTDKKDSVSDQVNSVVVGKVVCSDRRCDWKGTDQELLRAKHPFMKNDTVSGCPKCKRINIVVYACEYSGCWERVTCGTSTENGYMSTCGEHQPKKS